MNKILPLLLFVCLSVTLYAKPYLYEYRGDGYIVIFRGDILEKNEPQIRSNQTKYLESLKKVDSSQPPYYRLRGNPNYIRELKRIGITVEILQDNPRIDSENAYPPLREQHYKFRQAEPYPQSAYPPEAPIEYPYGMPPPPYPFAPGYPYY